jgi:DNA polymerase IIIc chi subunit
MAHRRREALMMLALVALCLACASNATAQIVAKVIMVAGDRQIAVNTKTPPQPYKVRALDAAGNPVPGVNFFIGMGIWTGSPEWFDEFHWHGFHAGAGLTPVEPLVGYHAVTDAEGIATAQAEYFAQVPSAFIVVATPMLPTPEPPGIGYAYALQKNFSVVIAESQPPGVPSVVVEYFHSGVRHYFNTIDQREIDQLESGAFAGWSRSIGSFIAYATAQDAPAGAVPVCRFWSARYTAHFYTADPTECQTVIDRWPDAWTLEARDAFYLFEPDKSTGQCAVGLMPVYRLYSTRNGPNHRYVTDQRLRDVMVAAGWIAEGYGDDNVMLCTPR